MNVLMKWLSITVLIFSTFASNETKFKSQYKGVCWNPEREKWYVDIEFKGKKASWSGLFKDELDAAKRVNQICENLKIPHLNPGIGSNLNENHQNISSLYHASKRGRKDTVKSLLEEEKENLIEFVMKRNIGKFTALHLASKDGHEEIVKLLLNVFGEKEKEKLIQYVLIKNILNETALNYALANEHKTVVKLLLNVFGKEDEKILLSQNLVIENNKKLLWDIKFITQMFKAQTKDAKKNSPLWSIFSISPARNAILSFIITDYYYNVFGRHGAEENILNFFSTNYKY